MKSAPTPSYTLCFATAVVIHSSAWLLGLFPQKTEATFFVAQSDHLAVELIETPDMPVQDSVPDTIPQPAPPPEPIPEPLPEPVPEPKAEPEKPKEEIPPPPKTVPPTPPVAAPTPPPAAAKPMARVKARTNPDYYRNPPPPYPEAARRSGITGLVLLHVRVGIDGSALEVTIKAGSGSTLLDRSARRAVQAWRFQPARLGDTAVEDNVDVPIRFSLNDGGYL